MTDIDGVLTLLDGAQPAIFTDFDGTLVEIAPTPEAVTVPQGLIDRLLSARQRLDGALAVVTGRPIATVDAFLAPLVLPVAGGHGTERRRADGVREHARDDIRSAAAGIARELEPLAAGYPRLIVEPKSASVAIHFRQAPHLEPLCHAALEVAISNAPLPFAIVEGKQVYEARPMGMNKGIALRSFMREQPFAGRVPVFIGDDRTDEDGFDVAQELGGIGIKLGEGKTHARLRFPGIAEAHELIDRLGRPVLLAARQA